MTTTGGVLTLTGIRERAAGALAPHGPDDPPVLAAPVDSADPPALVLAWDDPWITFRTPCLYDARVAVLCLAGRLTPDAGVEELEELVSHVAVRMREDAYPWVYQGARAPRLLELGGVPLLAARVIYSSPVTMGGP